MKNLLLFILKCYRKFVSPIFVNIFGSSLGCRFEERCSAYSMRVISEYGVLKGVYLSFLRLSKCHPFYSGNLNYESI